MFRREHGLIVTTFAGTDRPMITGIIAIRYGQSYPGIKQCSA